MNPMIYSCVIWRINSQRIFQGLAFLLASVLALLTGACQETPRDASGDRSPNFIIIFADDLGYGDLGTYGHPTIRTPNLDRMAREGQKWTNFYVGASVCTPSRAALLTGRLPVRSGMASNVHRVLFPDSQNGLPAAEITLAEQLKKAGYATACVGKWHLGHREAYLPTNHGFDYYYGIPYSNDMNQRNPLTGPNAYADFWSGPESRKSGNFNVPLLRGTEVIEQPARQETITKRYTEEGVQFIQQHQGEPFFLYLAHSLPHIPLFASEAFLGTSERGLYGDVVEEIDHGVGLIMHTLDSLGLADHTILVFTSDNGPWTVYGKNGGSAGLLRDGKGTTWEGGMREPGLFWSPGQIEPAVITGKGTTMDLYTTFSTMAGVPIPDDRVVDGVDLTPVLLEGADSPRETVFYYRGADLFAVRKGAFKAHLITQGAYGGQPREEHETPLLYNLSEDPGEEHNIAADHPEIIEDIMVLIEEHQATLVRGPDQLRARGPE